MTLTEFLLARIAKDESVANSYVAEMAQEFGTTEAELCSPLALVGTGYMDYTAVSIDFTRVLAECEAKRRIVELHPIYRGPRIQPVGIADFGCELCHALDRIHEDSLVEALGYCDTVFALALPYADHPDYREEWRP